MSKPKTAAPEITYYLCGGTAINIGALLKQNSHTQANKAAHFVGLDSSGNNKSMDLFEVERMKSADNREEARGSGKVKRTNYPQAEDFVEQTLAKHKPTSFNVIVQNTAGGTGSMLGPMVVRALEKSDEIYVVLSISDFTSKQEMENAIGTLRSLANQTARNQLNVSIPFIHLKNTTDVTRGQVNNRAVDRLNLLSLFLTELNEEMDYQDIKNLFKYSRHFQVPAALSEIRFFNQDNYKDYNGKPPVGVASLFKDRNLIVPRFEGSVIRTTGVFNEDSNLPDDIQELHLTLDHGEALEELEKQIADLDERRISAKSTYVDQRDVSQGADDNGMIL